MEWNRGLTLPVFVLGSGFHREMLRVLSLLRKNVVSGTKFYANGQSILFLYFAKNGINVLIFPRRYVTID